MTVVVAFATDGIAFVGADTKRTLSAHPTSKLHIWSDRVLFGQAGNAQHLTEAIVIAFRSQSLFGCDLAGLFAAFDAARNASFSKAVAANAANPNRASGVLLIAHAGDATYPGGLWTMDFDPSKAPVQISGQVGAIGLPGAKKIAIKNWMQHAASPPFRLGHWAMATIDQLRCSDVDWPIDAAIARGGSCSSERFVLRQRLSGMSSMPEHLFEV